MKKLYQAYYAGTERLAAVIGSGGLGNMVSPIAPLGSQHEQDIIKPFYTHYQNYDPSTITERLANRKRRKILRKGQVRIWIISASQPNW